MTETSSNPDYSTLSSPGAILKRCREYHGITLDEAAEATKIGVNYLLALEEDQINKFASQAYLKGFLRTYATHLGLNADDMMRLYEKLYAPAETSSQGPDQPNSTASRRRQRIPWKKLTLPAGLLIMILISSAIINRTVVPTPQHAAPLTTASSVPAVPVQPVLSSARSTSAVEKSKTVSEPAEVPVKEEVRPEQPIVRKASDADKTFVLRMKVISNSTLAVTIDGTAAQDYELAAGDVIEWKADRNIILELSNAGAVEAELNGKTLKPFGPTGKTAYVVLDAEGVKQ
ncbi:helix-turn-helix domain-containing protein [Pelotalea chapellei]|uniref:DUF4115 domain-containing protein n=1 Tax=Pelotalea chapellei TaxID=44671 RepID=A0ABS5UAM4_9BACT|nr:helix-turn-helix domain-containing protein [Pelotalea chapellei]MBT1072696.1 DUF4115 domain-containing protein [Pelotalea chapellei]